MRYVSKIIVVIFCLLGPGLEAQENTAYFQEKYQGANVVNSLVETKVDIQYNDSGEPVVFWSEERRRIYLTDAASQYSKDQFVHSIHYPLKEFEAYTLVPSGKKTQKIVVRDFALKTEFSDDVFHDGEESRNFFYPSLCKGAVSVARDVTEIKILQLLSSFYLQDYYPTDKRKILITTDPGIEMDFSALHMDGYEAAPLITRSKKNIKYEWTFENIEGYEFEMDGPDLRYYIPHMIPRIKSYEKAGQQVNVLNSVEDLHSWYVELISAVNTDLSDEMKMLADSLTANDKTDIEKLASVYYWSQQYIKYVAFEDGMKGFIPDDGNAVFTKRFGDCKGITSLLYSMLKYVGLDVYFTYVGTRNRPYTYEDVPTPATDNHMILACETGGEYLFLDGTSSFGNVMEIPHHIMGKEAMIIKGDGNFDIVEIPVTSYDFTMFSDSIILELESDGTISGTGSARLTGHYSTAYRAMFTHSSRKEIEELLEDKLQLGNNKFQIDTFRLSDFSDRSTDIEIWYKYKLEDYLMMNGDEWYLSLGLVKIYEDDFMDESRSVPLEKRFKSRNKLVFMIRIPEGKKVEFVPDVEDYLLDSFGYSLQIEEEGAFLKITLDQYDNFLLLGPDDFTAWNKMIKGLRDVYRESIIIAN